MLNGGVASLTLDGKGRLMVPARLRADMSDATLVVTLESAKCLLLYPLSCWQPVEARLMSLPANDPAALRFQRLVLGHVHGAQGLGAQGQNALEMLIEQRLTHG